MSQAFGSSPSRTQLNATLVWQSQSNSLTALIDFGAGESLLDIELANRLGITSEPLQDPLEVNALNSQLLARGSHRTIPPSLIVSGNFNHLLDFPLTPLVLGHHWL